jgi:hypothetical protein
MKRISRSSGTSISKGGPVRTPTTPRLVLILMLAVLGLGIGDAGAQSGGGYDLTWSSLDCGSPVSSLGNSYTLKGSIGQPESGALAGGNYTIQGGWSVPTDVAPPDLTAGSAALVFRLHGNAPNPFTTTTAIAFTLPGETDVELRVFDLAGRLVRDVLQRRLGPGKHQVVWDGRDASGRRAAHGIYLLRLQAGELRAHRKLAIVP